MPTLLSFLGPEHSWATQTSAGDFIKAIITVSANASQNEQACIGPNELTRQLVSKPCVEKLISYMLGGGNPLTVGVGIIIEVIRKNNSDYDPDVGPDNNAQPSSRDPIYLGTLLRMFAEAVPDFMGLIMNAPSQKAHLESTFGDKIEPLGFDRFKTCELMAELLHCSNMALLNEVGSEQVIALRDEERQKLRSEGKLSLHHGDEAQSSAEDLTMRGRHSSPDDGRRLEVTNASDDDGFEEVTPSGEMIEDTSHEFVKAEEEISAGPTSSFLDKDDDEFVDEPLSSPRLNTHDNQVHEQDTSEFENPELVVAPLSPRKSAATPPVSTDPEAQAAGSTPTSAETSQDAATPGVASETSPEAPPPASATTSPAGGAASESQTVAEPSSENPSSPRPTAVEPNSASTVAEAETPVSTDEAVDTNKVSEEAEPAKEEPVPDTGASTTPEPKIEIGEAPAADGNKAEQPKSVPSEEQTGPVVGDFLKMQFVNHRVVPTILVSYFVGRDCGLPLTCTSDLLLQIPLEQLPPQRGIRHCTASLQRPHGSWLQPNTGNLAFRSCRRHKRHYQGPER